MTNLCKRRGRLQHGLPVLSSGLALTEKRTGNLRTAMQKIGFLYGMESTFPAAVIEAINRRNVEGVRAESLLTGGIKMAEVSGSGDAHTVNGAITAQFANNPSAVTSFKSVNGMIDVYFQPGLSADLLLKTFNGQVYTDFDVTARPTPVGATEQRNGKFVYHSSGFRAVRVGSGGPELTFNTLNGDIRLHNNSRGTESK